MSSMRRVFGGKVSPGSSLAPESGKVPAPKPAATKPAQRAELKEDTEAAWMGKDCANLSRNLAEEARKVKQELRQQGFELTPYRRRFERVEEATAPEGLRFSMMQFNVLADGLSGSRDDVEARVDPKGFVKSPHESLPWRVRGFAILEEILRYGGGPDVLCLEEVDQYKFMEHFLGARGYEGRFKAKQKSPCVKVGKKYGLVLPPDGTAIFWKTAKFDLVQAHRDFAGMPHEDAVQFVRLRSKEGSRQELLVGVMHLKSKKKREGEVMRLEQLLFLMPRVRELAKDIPVFIGCDLNAESGLDGSKLEYAPWGYQSLCMPELLLAQRKQDEELRRLLATGYQPGFGLQLHSAYRQEKSGEPPREPRFTTWKVRDDGEAKHTIDYIFYQRHRGVRVLERLSIPREEEVNQETKLPGWEFPSDHFSIAAVFHVPAAC